MTAFADARGHPRWLLRRPSDAARGRVFCFPYSGVGASMFNRWPHWIDRVEVCPVQLPGRENRVREPHFGTYQELAEILSAALLPYLDRPSVFFGHCSGALPAFETARLASQDLREPYRLMVSAQVAPHDCPHDRFLDCTDAELLDELRRLALARGGQPHPALLEHALSVLRQDLAANRVYRLDGPVRVPMDITVLHWSADPEVTLGQLAGWRHYADDVRFVQIDGGHYDFLSAPSTLLDHISEAFSGVVT